MNMIKKIALTSTIMILAIINTGCNKNNYQTKDLSKIKLIDNVYIEIVKIKAGTFKMGSPLTEQGRDKDEIIFEATISQDFYIGKYEVTQEEYEAVMGINPSKFKNSGNPVDSVSYFEALEFCKKLNELTKEKRPEGYEYTLPTEAQWEYACRAGTTTPFSFGNELTSKEANFDGMFPYPRSNKKKFATAETTVPVGAYAPNTWGLYDMHGNVWEWCLDDYREYTEVAKIDPIGIAKDEPKNTNCVVRGGGWEGYANNCRSAFRRVVKTEAKIDNIGFRVALVKIK